MKRYKSIFAKGLVPGWLAVSSFILLALSCVSISYAQTQEIQSRLLSDNVLFIQGPQSNVLAVQGSEGLVLVDGGHASWYDSLRSTLESHFPGVPVRALINTHWHAEQTGANEPLGKEGVEIIAHENTWLWLSTEVWQRWSDTIFQPLAEEGLPTLILRDDDTLEIGDMTIHIGFIWNAHTDGDIWVYFENEDVLATGGMVSNGRWPEIDWWTGGYIGGLLDSFISLLTVPSDSTVIIPGYGDVMSLEEIKAQNQMYLTIFDRLHAAFIRSSSIDDVLEETPTAEFDDLMGDPTHFLSLAYQGFQWRVRDPQNFRILNIP